MSERVFAAMERIGKRVHLVDAVRRARSDAERNCGLCQQWMKCTCPREARGVRVSCGAPICDSFAGSDACARADQRLDEAVSALRQFDAGKVEP